MKWTDTHDIAIALTERYPDIDPQVVRFVDLHNWIVGLENFDDQHGCGGEKVLEAIQMAWIDETR
ncbi:Fe-S cluster assembly protein IscX [Candidatus Pandoraea novymonadis]|uniref:Fe-S assembly protein IscX n=1 Tax=Candidatus Pandoraea novymonadis TaxID=1808959 RepID=A0ABX5FEK7_9BURK|nr:Fe-S cluster assembly protein IscX [Candidatus Pandoraea novymonadis]PSB92069.1 hypothetical protein BZL35_00295 [Candidatus Pandoraea novymonadis]